MNLIVSIAVSGTTGVAVVWIANLIQHGRSGFVSFHHSPKKIERAGRAFAEGMNRAAS